MYFVKCDGEIVHDEKDRAVAPIVGHDFFQPLLSLLIISDWNSINAAILYLTSHIRHPNNET